MANNSQKFIYAMRAVYEGKGEVAALQSDLQAMGKIKSFEKLQGDFAATTTALNDAKTRMRELKTLMNAPGGEAFTAEYQKAATEVKKLSTNLQKQKTALDKSRESMQSQGFAMNDLSGEYQKLDTRTTTHGQKIAAMKTLGVRSFADVEQKVDSLHAAYKVLEKDPSISARELRAAKNKMEADIESLTGKTNGLAGKFNQVKTGILALGAGLAAGGYGLANMVQQAGAGARELDNLSRLAGTSVENFSAAAYAVESVGISGEKLADMSKDVQDKLGDFIATGGGPFKDFFDNVAPKVGLTAEALKGLSGPDVLVAVKKAMDDANVSAEEQVFYLEAIANDATLLTPLLAENGKALKEKADRARELGIAISDIDNAKLLEMEEANRELGKTMGVLRTEIVSAVAPALQFLVGNVQQAVAWFNTLSPGMQKFIIFTGAGATAVAALGMVFAPLIATITMGAPLLGIITSGLGTLAGGATTAAVASKLLSVALRGIPLIGIALAIYEIGKAMGIWTPILETVQKGAISLAAGVHLLGLKVRWLWNVLTGDDAEVAALEKRMEEVDTMYGKMFANIGKKQEEQTTSSKDSQGNITKEVKKGALEQLTIAQETAAKMAKAYASVDGVADKKGKKEKPDEFGRTEAERKAMDEELEKLDASRAQSKGRQVKDVDFVVDPRTGAITDQATGSYSSLATNVERRLADLPKLDAEKTKASASAEKAPKRVVEVKFPSGSLQGDEDVVEKVIADLQRMGTMA